MLPARQLILHGGVLFLAVGAVQPWAGVPLSIWPTLRVYAWFILVIGVLMAWIFQRSRVVYGLLVLALAGEALGGLPAGQIKPTGAATAIPFDLVAILLPLNLAAIGWMGECGLLSLRGLGRLGLIVGQAGAVVAARRWGWPELAAGVRHDFFQLPMNLLTPLHQPALLAFAVALGALGVLCWRRPRPIEASFVAALAGAFLALHMPAFVPGLPAVTLFTAAAQAVLVLGLVQASHALAYRDELTSLPSRRALSEFLPQLGRQYAIAMIDVDHFKKFNDRYGHATGDQVLRMVAAKLARISGSGKVFRYGGEEFTIVFPGRSVDETVDHLEHLQKSIEQGGFAVRGPQRPRRVKDERRLRGRPAAHPARKVRVTVSMGVAEPAAGHGDPQTVLQAADKALYRAKKAGRNQISD